MRRLWALTSALGLGLGAFSCGGASTSSDASGQGGTAGSGADSPGGSSGASTGGSSSGGSSSGGSSSGGDGGNGGSPTGSPVSIEDYPDAVAEAFCGILAPCCNAEAFELEESTCRESMSALVALWLNGADPNNIDYDPAAAGNCIASIERELGALNCSTDSELGFQCPAAFHGKLQPGEPCSAAVECEIAADEQAECADDVEEGVNTCIIRREAALGESCTWTCSQEESGLRVCQSLSSGMSIQGSCETSQGLYCSGGTCAALVPNDGTCTNTAQCAAGYCDPDTERCVGPGRTGDACARAEQCDDGLFCLGGSCGPGLPLDSACTLGDRCQGGRCEEEVCVAGEEDPRREGLAFICGFLADPPPGP